MNRINELASINGMVEELSALKRSSRCCAAAQTQYSIKRTVSRELFELLESLRRTGVSASEG